MALSDFSASASSSITDSSLQLGLACSVVSFPVLFLFSERKQFRRCLLFGRIDVWLVFALHWHCAHPILFSKRYGFYGSNFFTKYTNIKKEKMCNWLATPDLPPLAVLVPVLCLLVPRTGQPFKLLGRLFLVFCLRRSAMRSLPWLTQVASVVGKSPLAGTGGSWWLCVRRGSGSLPRCCHTQLICLVQAETKNLVDTIRPRLHKVPPKIGLPVTKAKRMHIMRRSGSKHLGSCPLLVSRVGECSHFFLLFIRKKCHQLLQCIGLKKPCICKATKSFPSATYHQVWEANADHLNFWKQRRFLKWNEHNERFETTGTQNQSPKVGYIWSQPRLPEDDLAVLHTVHLPSMQRIPEVGLGYGLEWEAGKWEGWLVLAHLVEQPHVALHQSAARAATQSLWLCLRVGVIYIYIYIYRFLMQTSYL